MEEIVLHFKTNYYSSGSLELDCCLSRATSNKWSGPITSSPSTRTSLDNKTGRGHMSSETWFGPQTGLVVFSGVESGNSRPPSPLLGQGGKQRKGSFLINKKFSAFFPSTNHQSSPPLSLTSPGATLSAANEGFILENFIGEKNFNSV